MLVPNGLFIISHPSMPVLEVLESLNLGAPLLKLVYRPVYSRTKKRKALSAASSKAPGPKYAKFRMPRGSVAQSKKYCIYRCFFGRMMLNACLTNQSIQESKLCVLPRKTIVICIFTRKNQA